MGELFVHYEFFFHWTATFFNVHSPIIIQKQGDDQSCLCERENTGWLVRRLARKLFFISGFLRKFSSPTIFLVAHFLLRPQQECCERKNTKVSHHLVVTDSDSCYYEADVALD